MKKVALVSSKVRKIQKGSKKLRWTNAIQQCICLTDAILVPDNYW